MKKINWQNLIIAVIIPLLVGGLSALFTRGGMEDFEAVSKPFLTPPSWLFPVAWSVLYILMGVASYIIFMSEDNRDKVPAALTSYGVQLLVNFFWSILFFNLKVYLLSFAWLVLLWILIMMTMASFSKISKNAALLLLPYLLWVTFAGYLNFGEYILN